MRLTTAVTRRPGVTLVEVLVAIFVMAIGLMALLTLFPLGALSMAQAIKDQRTSDEAHAMNGVARAYWRLYEEYKANATSNVDAFLEQAFTDPCQNDPGQQQVPEPQPGWLPNLSQSTGPSYPVIVDVFGFNSYPGSATNPMPPVNWKLWLAGQAGQGNNGVPRRTMNYLFNNFQPNNAQPAPPWNGNNLILSLFSGLDDLTFDLNGTPVSPVVREGRYSAALMLRRPTCNEPRFVQVTVIVYSGRSLQLAAPLVPSGEAQYMAYPQGFTQGSNVVQIDYSVTQSPRPNIRRGDWVMDAMMYNPANPSEPPRGYFYRVVNVTDVGPTTIELELQQPARAGNGTSGPLVILDNVVEVFDKPMMGP